MRVTVDSLGKGVDVGWVWIEHCIGLILRVSIGSGAQERGGGWRCGCVVIVLRVSMMAGEGAALYSLRLRNTVGILGLAGKPLVCIPLLDSVAGGDKT